MAASAQPILLGPENPLPVRAGIASSVQYIQGAPSDGTNRLIVWLDDRNSYPDHPSFSDFDKLVLAARVDARGHVLDIPNIVLPMRAHGPVLPFWNGHEYVVVTAGEYTRISAGGEITGHGTFAYPRFYADSIAWSGDRLLLVTQVMNDVHAVVYDASFNVVRDEFVLIDHTLPRRTVAASNGDGFMVVGPEFDAKKLTVVLLDRNGAVSHALTINNTFGLEIPMLASDGEKYVLVTLTSPSFTERHFVSYAVTADGLVFPKEFSFGTPGAAVTPELQWQGDKYALAYGATRSVSIVQLDRDGLVRGEVALLDHVPTTMHISAGAAPHIFFWSDTSLAIDRGQLYTDPATFAQSAAQGFVLGQGSMPQETPVAATAGDVSLLVWRERTAASGPLALYAARADRFGRILDAQPLHISDVTCDVWTPAVATNKHDFLVAWQEGSSIRAMRVGRDGRLLDPAPIIVSNDEAEGCRTIPPQVAANDSSYLVAWGSSARPSVLFDGAVKAKRISFDGALLDAGPIGLATSFASNLQLTDFHLASDGHEFMVGWTVGTYALVMRLTAEGTPREFGGITLAMPGVRALFWDGTNYVALSYAQYERITSGGQRLDVTPSGKAPSITLPDALTRPGTRGFSVPCDASGCGLYSWSDGMLVSMRFDDTASGLVPVTTTLAPAGNTEWRSIVMFGEGPLKNVSYLRLAPEAPYAGSWHLFVRPTLAPRGRSVR